MVLVYKSISCDRETISLTSYVDNIILITESGGDIQRAIDGITESLETFTFNNYVLKINEKYTNLLIYVRKLCINSNFDLL